MCGIFGFVASADKDAWFADKLMSEGLFAQQLRGRDSTGIFGQQAKRPGTVEWLKATGPADQFFKMEKLHKKFIKDLDKFRFAIGHNRAATVGKADDPDAAHPHQIKDITLVHNGTLRTYDKTFVSDSKFITSLLTEEPDFSKISKELHGAFALVWHDKRDDTLNIARNSERPLGFVTMGYDKAIWIASELPMLRWIVGRNNKVVSEDPKDSGMFESGVQVKFHPDGKKELLGFPLFQSSTTTGHGGSKHKPVNQMSWPAFMALSQQQAMEEEERQELLEQARALETVQHGASAHVDITTEESSELPPLPVVIKPTKTGGVATVKKPGGVGAYTKLEEWSGNVQNDSIWFAPTNFRHDNTDKSINMTGPIVVWTEKGAEILNGVIVHATLKSTSRTEENPITASEAVKIMNTDSVYEGQIAAIFSNASEKKIHIYIKDPEYQEWLNFEDYGLERKDAYKAARAEADDFAEPGVSASQQKKS